VLAPLITAIAGGLLGLVASYLGVQWKIHRDLEARYDSSLRDLRLKVYAELWALLKPLAAFGPRDDVSRQELDEMTGRLRDWYFDRGGLYLSTEAREAYFRLQRGLRVIVSSQRWQRDDLQQLDQTSFEHLRRIGSRLRTKLTLDVGTRRPFSMESRTIEDPAWPQRDAPTDADEGPIVRAWRSEIVDPSYR
jgi:hypothetical protein